MDQLPCSIVCSFSFSHSTVAGPINKIHEINIRRRYKVKQWPFSRTNEIELKYSF